MAINTMEQSVMVELSPTPLHNIQIVNTERPIPCLTKHSGYTLLELLLVMAISVILLTIAAPSFAAMTANTKIKVMSKSMLHTLALARTKALSETRTTLVCQLDSNQPEQCVSSPRSRADWSNGWQVFVDRNDNARFDAQDLIISRVTSVPDVAIVFNQNGRLRFFNDGSARSAGFYVCSKNSKLTRHIKILHSGRTRVTSKLSKQAEAICKKALANDHSN